MELRHLRYFVVAAEEENFHRAARRLNLAQPALSRQIRDLEVELGVTLFDRGARKVRLSLVGTVFYEDARTILRQVETSCERARRASHGQVGTLRIAFNSLAARHVVLSSSLDAFRQRQPDVELKLRPMVASGQLAVLKEGELDAGFLCFRPEYDTELSFVPLFSTDVVVAVPATHELGDRDALVMEDFRDLPFVYFPRSHSPDMYDRVHAAFREKGVFLRTTHEAVAEEVLLGFVSAGMGVTLVPSDLENRYSGSVRFKQVKDLSIPLRLDFVWLKSNRSAALAHFVESVRKAKEAIGDGATAAAGAAAGTTG